VALENKKEGLLNSIQNNKKTRIVIRGTIYPGTIIQIGLLKKEIMKKVKNCTLRSSSGQIVFTSNI
jgi:hypothetical protein